MKQEDFLPESGLAKTRMKQFIENASNNNNNQNSNGGGEIDELSGKGVTKSLLSKWKSIEHLKDEPGSLTANGEHQQRRSSKDEVEEENLPQSGNAKNLLNKWKNIEETSTSGVQRKGPRAITPPPPEELERQRLRQQAEDEETQQRALKKTIPDEELAIIGKGAAKNALAK
jgi:hypothetical protein